MTLRCILLTKLNNSDSFRNAQPSELKMYFNRPTFLVPPFLCRESKSRNRLSTMHSTEFEYKVVPA